MIYDIFSFYGEYHLLELRIKENWDYIDRFILVQGDKTFQGNNKSKLFGGEDNQKFKWSLEKLEVHNVALKSRDDPTLKSPWDNENLQISYVDNFIKSKNEDDLFFFGSIDEIPNKKKIPEIINNYKTPLTMEQDFFYYAFNNKVINSKWTGTILLKKKDIQHNSLTNIFNKRYFELPRIASGGWHFSFLGDSNEIIKKIESYSHNEYNTEYFKNKSNIEKKIKESIDIYERKKGDKNLGGQDPLIMEKVIIDSSFPDYLKNNKEKFNKYIF